MEAIRAEKKSSSSESKSIEKDSLNESLVLGKSNDTDPEFSREALCVISALSELQGTGRTSEIFEKVYPYFPQMELFTLNCLLTGELVVKNVVIKIKNNPPVWKLVIASNAVDSKYISNKEKSSNKSLICIFIDLSTIKTYELNPILPYINDRKRLYGFAEIYTNVDDFFKLMIQFNSAQCRPIRFMQQKAHNMNESVPLIMSIIATKLLVNFSKKKKKSNKLPKEKLYILILSKLHQIKIIKLIPQILSLEFDKPPLISEINEISKLLPFIEE